MKNKPNNIKQKDWDAINSPPLSDDLLQKMRPVRELHPERPARVRGQQKLPVKVPVYIRLSPEIVEFFRAQGKGWQTNINVILRKYVKTHSAA